MSDAILEILLRAKDQTARDFAAFNRRVKNSSRTLNLFKASLAGIAAGFTLDAAIRGMSEFTGAASDMEETVSKVNTLFGGTQGDLIADWADTAADAMGLSAQAALDATGTMGNMFLQLGQGAQDAAKTSQGMVQLAADLASFHNVAGGATDVLNAMQSAFRGEYDALQRYIPTIKAATVQQEALAMTGKSSVKELTELEKAMAAVKIITKDAGAAVGDVERTSDSFQNTTRRLNAEWDNLSVTIGQHFVDAAAKAKGAMADMVAETNQFLQGPSIDEQILAAQARIAQLQIDLEERRAREVETVQDRRARQQAQWDARQERRHARNRQRTAEAIGFLEQREAAEKAMFDAATIAEQADPRAYEERRIEAIKAHIEHLQELKKEHQDVKQAVKGVNTEIENQTELIKEWDKQMEQIDPNDLMPGKVGVWDIFQGPTGDVFDGQRDLGKEMKDHWEKVGKDMIDISEHTANSMQDAFADFFFDAMTGELESLADYVRGFMRSIMRMFAQVAAQQAVSGLFPGSTGVDANITQITPMAKGGVVSGPAVFPFAGGVGLMGEEGPEAIMPLKRTASGKLGVESSGGGSMNVVINFTNNTGSNAILSVTNQGYDSYSNQYICDVVLEKVHTDRNYRRQLMGG